MTKLWEFPEDIQRVLIESSLSKHGLLIGEMSSPHSNIFTFDQGPHSYPRYVIAKGVQVVLSMSEDDKRKFFVRALYEVNNAYAVCHHPSIQRFFDLQIIYGVPFLLSRKRDATLRDIIAEGPLLESEALSVAIQIVHALRYCVTKGLYCHQDLKPENIFIDFLHKHFSVPDGYSLRHRIHVADFELANAYIVLGHPFGSRPYMAPEQYANMQKEMTTDFSRVDVFAIGVMLFEMLSGGIHPVGEQTSLVWPLPVKGKSRKWLREDPWKQWLKNQTPIRVNDSHIASESLLIIRDCLQTDHSKRLSKEDLEARLLQRLRLVDRNAFDTLSATLAHFDQIADENEEGGWPHYAERLEKLNEAFSGRTPS